MDKKMKALAEERTGICQAFAKVRSTAEEKKIFPIEEKFASPEYLDLVRETDAKSEKMLKSWFQRDLDLCGPEHFSRENVFVWGGPTPSWGGSMAKDASLKAKKYFDVDNVMYVYGPINDEMLSIHRSCGKVICHLGRNCRTAGAAMASDPEEAEMLSRMSLKYPNVVGGVVDDMSGNYGFNYSQREYRAIYESLHKHNPKLELYGVVYSWELDGKSREVRAIADFIDHVILWFWKKTDLMEMDLAVERCRAMFPGKPIMLGIFMFDYGIACLPNSVETMKYHLEKARRYLAAGRIHDIVILGDREIEKCPKAARYIKTFLKKEFAASCNFTLD